MKKGTKTKNHELNVHLRFRLFNAFASITHKFYTIPMEVLLYNVLPLKRSHIYICLFFLLDDTHVKNVLHPNWFLQSILRFYLKFVFVRLILYGHRKIEHWAMCSNNTVCDHDFILFLMHWKTKITTKTAPSPKKKEKERKKKHLKK